MMGIVEPVIGRRFAPTRWLHPSYELLRCRDVDARGRKQEA